MNKKAKETIQLAVAGRLADTISSLRVAAEVTGLDLEPAIDQTVLGVSLICKDQGLCPTEVVAQGWLMHFNQSHFFTPSNN
jgi:hypothetical protein